jgi:hypothetical protein
MTLSAQVNVGKITSLEIDGPLKVEVAQAAEAQIEVLNDSDLVTYETNGNALVIIAQYVPGRETPKVRISLPKLSALHTTGAVVLNGSSLFSPRQMTLRIGGQSVVELEIDVEELDAEAEGQSVLKLQGQADLLKLIAKEQSVIQAGQLKSADARAEARGQSTISLAPAAKMDTQVEVGSIVNY